MSQSTLALEAGHPTVHGSRTPNELTRLKQRSFQPPGPAQEPHGRAEPAAQPSHTSARLLPDAQTPLRLLAKEPFAPSTRPVAAPQAGADDLECGRKNRG